MTDVKTTNHIPTRDELKQRAGKIYTKLMNDHDAADTRRGWNRFTGQIPSKNDVIRAAQADLRLLNDLCSHFGYKPIWDDPDAEEVKMGELKD